MLRATRSAPTQPADKLFFLLGRHGAEDFVEVLLNAGNGYGLAALKLLRPMFERLVTMMHLIRNPQDVQPFVAYHHVHAWKVIKHIEAGGDDPKRYYLPEDLYELEKNYRALAPKVRKMRSWTSTDLATMARNVGLGPEYLSLSYFPTMYLHTTVLGITSRLEGAEGGEVISFKTGSQRQEADTALWGAHLCLSRLLEDQVRHFGLAVNVERVRVIFDDCWPGEAGEPNRAGTEEREE